MKITITLLTHIALLSSMLGLSTLSHSEESISMEGLSIIGNKELPNVLYILPWKSPDLPDMNEPILEGLVDTSLELVDRESVLRQELYSKVLTGR